MKANFHIEVETAMLAKHGQTCCGDVFQSRKLREENRIVAVLSDGIGQGIQANILASMTSTMALQFALNHETAERTAEFIIRTLPFDAKRKITHATFSMIDINYRGEAKTIEYRNPNLLWFGGHEQKEPVRTRKQIAHSGGNQPIELSHLKLCKEDRLVLVSDGIARSGLKNATHPFGWEAELGRYIKGVLQTAPTISAQQLATKIVQRALHNDGGLLSDDASCCVVYCREPRQLIIASGPPYHKAHDKFLADEIAHFQGKKVVCGGTTANILARELKCPVTVNMDFADPSLPPTSRIEGIDLVTEGILTLGKTSSILEQNQGFALSPNGPAEQLAKMLLGCDEIKFMVGTKVNEAHHDPNLPVELEIRRNVIKKMAALLEEKYLKKVEINYL